MEFNFASVLIAYGASAPLSIFEELDDGTAIPLPFALC
jgi:hypothetical protein